MKNTLPADLSLDDFLSDPIIFSHRPRGNDTGEFESETLEHENATPTPDAEQTAAHEVGNGKTTERNAS